MSVLPDNLKLMIIALVGSLILSFVLTCPVKATPLNLEQIFKTGDEELFLTTENKRLQTIYERLKKDHPEQFSGLPETTIWRVEAKRLPPRYYAIAEPDTRVISISLEEMIGLTDVELASILLHEVVHARLFAQGVLGSISRSVCANIYHEILAYATQLNYRHAIPPGVLLGMSAEAGYSGNVYEYEARYCHEWFAPVPALVEQIST